MYCPNCGTFSQPGARFCFHCGAPLPTEQAAPQITPQPVPAPIAEAPAAPISTPELPAPPAKKGSHIIPALILAAMSLLGLILFFALPLGTDSGNPTAPPSATPWFAIENGTLYFDEAYYNGSSQLTVPEKVNGETVQRLGDHCFAYCDGLTSVTLPDTLTEIDAYAFAGCTALRGIDIPESVTSIGAHAFEDCTALEAIRIPSGVTEIGNSALRRCSNLKYIFFDGSFAQWTALYDAKVNPNTIVSCTDGEFPLG